MGMRSRRYQYVWRIAAFLLTRAVRFLLLSLCAALLTFWLSSVIPGDFFSTHLLNPSVRIETVEQLRREHGLDQPFYTQFFLWVKNVVHLDLGQSMFYQRPVLSVVVNAITVTMWMALPALMLGAAAGVLFGTVHGLTAGRPIGKLLDVLSAIILSVPTLLVGITALLFAADTQIFPLGGIEPLENPAGLLDWMAGRARHLVLPVLSLAIPIAAYIERIQYSAAGEICREPYVRLARSRGLSRMRIFFHYVLRPGLNPVLSVSGPLLAGVLSGSLVLEVLFDWPGMGQITYDALFNSDLQLLTGCVMGSGLLLVSGNLLADFALILLDPRTRSTFLKSEGARP